MNCSVTMIYEKQPFCTDTNQEASHITNREITVRYKEVAGSVTEWGYFLLPDGNTSTNKKSYSINIVS